MSFSCQGHGLITRRTNQYFKSTIPLRQFEPLLPSVVRTVFRQCNGERWPPRCCTWRINLDNPAVMASLPPELAQLVVQRREYHATPGKLFCCDRRCRTYIAPDKINEKTNIGFCGACWGGTCASCRRHPHVGRCKEDFQQKAMERYFLYKGWKKCEVCGSIVEKRVGCNHMTCTCGEQFCYVCGQHWRSCNCPQHTNPEHNNDLTTDPVSAWFRFPQQPRCYGQEFRINTILPQTFSCAKCEHRCGSSGDPSYQCQDCGRHLCKGCALRCIADGRYHSPDCNAVPAEARGSVGEGASDEDVGGMLPTARAGVGED
ncbi:hypothetical protein KVR01_012951 [Diaporthe batatas]|uniref:uncharacterized protein n=1 Tax=Diaporthe batatas TaxID=748121 RepID=UPI001D04616A|nr:uncharacterized protein KVR01_012951 [Diaporthe batatas]KAG8157243.1 hypothetical protein KVR01_012951 [Diaporthe batatas]